MELAFGSTGEAYRRLVLDDQVVECAAAGMQLAGSTTPTVLRSLFALDKRKRMHYSSIS